MLRASYRHATGTADFNIDFRWELQSPSKSVSASTQLGIQPLADVKANLIAMRASVETGVSRQTSFVGNKNTTLGLDQIL